MASSPVPEHHKPEPHAGNVYCSDPTCLYCADLRLAEVQWKKEPNQEPRVED
jgi:5-methylcytosine-specific restriction endonuclease McrA